MRRSKVKRGGGEERKIKGTILLPLLVLAIVFFEVPLSSAAPGHYGNAPDHQARGASNTSLRYTTVNEEPGTAPWTPGSNLTLNRSSVPLKEPKLASSIAQTLTLYERRPFEVSSGSRMVANKYERWVAEGKIRVVLELTDEDAPWEKEYDLMVEARYKNLVQAVVPLSEVRGLADDAAVQYVRLPLQAYPMVTSEGVGVLNAGELHGLDIQGEGVKVAVIDLGFKGYHTNPDLPSANLAEVHSFRADGDLEAGEEHGAACAELVLDVAPRASLYLYNFDTEVGFGNAVDRALMQGVDIITHSIGWVNAGGYDGTGVICDIVNNARAYDTLFVAIAGNAAARHYEGSYTDADANRLHEFGPGDEILDLGTLPAGTPISLFLSWDDWPTSHQDYDLYLLVWDTGSGEWLIAAGSENPQTGTQPPAEDVMGTTLVAASWGVGIVKYSATRSVHFELYSWDNDFPEHNVKSSSLWIPGDAAGAITAGATYWADDSLEPYSSRGPTNDGRIKPDVTAPDGVSTYTYGTRNFYGTSSSAPHVAGAAALLLAAKPSLTANQLQAYLESTAVDRGALGKDNLYGAGRLDVRRAYNALIFPPEVRTAPASNVGTFSATLQGNLTDTGGESCQVWFEYGKTTAYGSSTPQHPLAAPGTYSAELTDLEDTATYHFRAVASNSEGSVYGDDMSFTTFDASITGLLDTGTGAYPSIPGTHRGTIRPYQTINVSSVYIYSCPGTGGHIEYIHLYGNGVNESASWSGYSGAWHNLSFNTTFSLDPNKTYSYELKTGSYPLLIHESWKDVLGGTITCTEFVDINGKSSVNGIPAIRLE